ncbi:MAG TPA: TIGR03016 family PEP-CTERM system-associated outer membrane protein [Rhodoferax sp.]
MAWAQDATQDTVKQAVSIVPRVSVTETLTNNVALSKSASAQSDQITEISPGIHLNINGARLKTYFDYSLDHVEYAQGTAASRNQNALTTFGTLEAIDNWAFIDFSGNISQQTISAFGTQSTNNTAVNANSTEVATYQLSPYVKGHFGNFANYEARVSRSVSSSDSATASNTASTNSVVRVSNASAFRSLGWSADVSRQQASYSAGRATEADSYSLGLTYAITPQVNVSVNGGQESNNYTSLDKQNYNTRSVGVNWSPSQNTTLSALAGKRSFGNTHNLSFEHRTARTVWRYSDSKDVLINPTQSGLGSVGSNYDLYFSQFASVEPDPVARAALVNNYLAANGINPNAVVLSNFLTSGVALQRRQDLSLALLGVRDTVTFLLSRSDSRRLDSITNSFDSLSSASSVVQNGFSANYSHRLTPDYSLGVLMSRQATAGDTAAQETTLKSFNVNVTGKVGKKAAASLGLRHVVSDGLTPYTETAVTGNLNVQF